MEKHGVVVFKKIKQIYCFILIILILIFVCFQFKIQFLIMLINLILLIQTLLFTCDYNFVILNQKLIKVQIAQKN